MFIFCVGVLLGWLFTQWHFQKRMSKAFYLFCGKQKGDVKQMNNLAEKFFRETEVKYMFKQK
jgi:hypothetical protein